MCSLSPNLPFFCDLIFRFLLETRCQFHRHFTNSFSYKNVMRSFIVLTVCVCGFFWQKEIVKIAAGKQHIGEMDIWGQFHQTSIKFHSILSTNEALNFRLNFFQSLPNLFAIRQNAMHLKMVLPNKCW